MMQVATDAPAMLDEEIEFVSLFAGIGGFDLGFEQAGMKCAAQVEIDKAARFVLNRQWPHVPKIEDVRKAGAHNLPKVPVICGGFPCQDLSVAGARAGFLGNRSSLFFEMVRITDELRPDFLIWENVPGLLSSRGGADFWRVLSELDTIGYCGAWTMLDAQWFGLAQRRRRIFGVFARRDIGATRCAEILALADRLRWNPTQSREAATNVTTAITKSLGAGGADDNDAQGGLLIMQEQGGFGVRTFENTTPTLQSEGGLHQGGPSRLPLIAAIAQCNRGHTDDLAETLRSDSHGALPMVFEPRFARNGRGAPDTVTPPLKSFNGGTGKGDGAPVVAFNWHGSNHLGNTSAKVKASLTNSDAHPPAVAQLAPTLGANSYSPSKAMSGSAEDFAIGLQDSVRRLTPTECERLQGFPDGHTAGQPDSARYRQLGNAVAVPVVRWIGKRLVAVTSDGKQVGQGDFQAFATEEI